MKITTALIIVMSLSGASAALVDDLAPTTFPSGSPSKSDEPYSGYSESPKETAFPSGSPSKSDEPYSGYSENPYSEPPSGEAVGPCVGMFCGVVCP